MIRLPQYDGKTRRAELVVFAALGCLGLAVVGGALFNAGRFAANRDGIEDTLTGGQPSQAVLASMPTNHSGTNLTGVRRHSLAEHAS